MSEDYDYPCYRGVVVVKIFLKDLYGNNVPAQKRLYTKPYAYKQSASAAATRLAKSQRTGKFLDKHIENPVGWEPTK